MSVSEGQAAVHSDACRSVGLGQNRPGEAPVESAGSKVGPVDVPTLMPGLPHSAEPQWHIRHGCFAAAHYRCSKAGYRAGSERGSPNHGSTLASKRVMAQIWPAARVST